MNQLVLTIGLMTVLSGVFYRLGGLSKDQAHDQIPWVPGLLIAGWVRDFGCSVLVLSWIYFYLPEVELWRYGLSFILMIPALRTYWDWWPPNRGEDNFFMHGLFIGLSLAPIAYELNIWVELAIRSLILGFLMDVWCRIFSNDWIEELGRGAFIGFTVAFLHPEALDYILSNL